VSLLTGLNKLVADIAGPLLFEQAKLLRGGSYSINPLTGQTVFTPSTEYVKAIEGDYSAFHRQSLDIPDINRKLSILGYQVTTPRPGDRVSIRGVIWEIVRVERDPANALYECEVKPIGADLAGDPGATVNALTPLPGLLASIAGPLLFGPATLFRAQSTSIDSNGQAFRSDVPETISGLEVEYTATHRAQAGIPETDRSLLVLGASLSAAPIPGDRVDINGLRYEIVRTQRDPARAVYECQARPIGIAVAIRYATHAGNLPAYVGAATAQLTFFYHAGILPAYQTVANATALISASSGASLPAYVGQAVAEVGALAYTGGVFAPYTGNATARVDIAAAHVGSLPPLAGVAVASVRVSGSHAGSLAPIAGTATATNGNAGASAEHAGALPALTGTATAKTATAASHTGTLAAMQGTATGSTAVAASSLQSLPAYQGSAQAMNGATAQSGSILPAFTGTAAAKVATVASHAGALPAYSGSGVAAGGVLASQAGTLPAYQGTALATVGAAASAATHAGVLPAFTGTATATGATVATHTSSLPAYQGTAVASNAIAATQARSLPAYLGSAVSANAIAAAIASNLPAYEGTATATVETVGGYDADAIALFARMTVEPAAWRKDAINALIVTLKSDAVWDDLSGLYVFKQADKQSAYLNWVQTQTITETGLPVTHVADQYSEGLATGDTDFLQTVNGIDSKFTETDAHYGIVLDFVRSYQNPVQSQGGFLASFINDGSSTGMNGRMHNGPLYTWGGLDPAHYLLSQASGALTPYKNGTATSSPITQDAGAPNGTFRLLRGNGFGDPINNRMSAFHLGRSLTSTKAAALYSALQTYFAAIDAGEPVTSVKADSTLIKSDNSTITADQT
jgi:hypothetical protein